MHLPNPHLPRPDIATLRPEIFHTCQRQFAQVARLNARGDERHRDVALDTVDTGPGGDEGEDTGDEVDEGVGGVIFVAAVAPEFVETGATDDEGGVDF